MLTIKDFDTLRVHERAEALHHSFGFLVPHNLRLAFQKAVECLLQVVGLDQRFDLFETEEGNDSILESLCLLQQHACAERHSSDDGRSTWSLTDHGKLMLKVHISLVKATKVLVPRGLAIGERTAFELAWMLRDCGWVCSQKTSRGHKQKRDKDADVAIVMIDYVVGGEKRWWLNPKRSTFCVEYMQCLLLAHTHKEASETLRPQTIL